MTRSITSRSRLPTSRAHVGHVTSAGVNVPRGSPSFRCYAGKASWEQRRAAGWPCKMDPCASYICETRVAESSVAGAFVARLRGRGGHFELAAMTSWRRSLCPSCSCLMKLPKCVVIYFQNPSCTGFLFLEKREDCLGGFRCMMLKWEIDRRRIHLLRVPNTYTVAIPWQIVLSNIFAEILIRHIHVLQCLPWSCLQDVDAARFKRNQVMISSPPGWFSRVFDLAIFVHPAMTFYSTRNTWWRYS